MMLDLSPLRASRGFQLLYAARAASFLAFGVLGVAVSLQMYALTSSSLQVAFLNAAVAGSMALALIVGGWLADSYDRRAVMVWSRTAHLLTILILMANAALAAPMVWPIYAAAVVGGSTFGFGMPAIMAATPALVGREHLSGAAALTAVAAQAGAIAGPFLAGAITAGAGLVACYGVVALISGITPIVLGFLPPLPPLAGPSAGAPLPVLAADEAGFMGGLRYIARSPLVLSLLLVDLVALVFAVPYVLLPELATHGLGGGPDSIGLLYAAPSVGALFGALASGRAGASPFAGRWLVACVAVWACACIALGFSEGMAPALFLPCRPRRRREPRRHPARGPDPARDAGRDARPGVEPVGAGGDDRPGSGGDAGGHHSPSRLGADRHGGRRRPVPRRHRRHCGTHARPAGCEPRSGGEKEGRRSRPGCRRCALEGPLSAWRPASSCWPVCPRARRKRCPRSRASRPWTGARWNSSSASASCRSR